jgi:uncharacterized membrane protein (DUF106 family)
MVSRKRNNKPVEVTVQERQVALNPVFALLFRLSDPQNFKWIALVIVVLLIPHDARAGVFLALQNYVLIITVLIAVVVTMAIMWHYTHKIDKMEIERLVRERDELQKKLDCPIRSSEEVRR